jgi:undecaprenyl-diphosphatase
MTIWDAIILGIVEGLTEFLPVSSTGHLTIVEKLLGLSVDDAGVTAFTAVIQVGAIIGSIVYFRADIVRLAVAWFRGLAGAEARREPDYRMAWLVIAGSIPIGVVGLLARHLITGAFRSLWVVVAGLVVWSVVMVLAERLGRQDRGEESLTLTDSLVVGFVQCISLVPGVSRSGATISAGLLRDFDRVSAARFSFLLSVPAVVLSGLFELRKFVGHGAGTSGGALVVATLLAFVVGYASIAFLLRFLTTHTVLPFVVYRVVLGTLVLALVAAGTIH